MKILAVLFKGIKEKSPKTSSDQQDSLITIGREQFKQLVDKNLGIPVALL